MGGLGASAWAWYAPSPAPSTRPAKRTYERVRFFMTCLRLLVPLRRIAGVGRIAAVLARIILPAQIHHAHQHLALLVGDGHTHVLGVRGMRLGVPGEGAVRRFHVDL